MAKRLTKEQVARLVARDLTSLTDKKLPMMNRLIPVHAPKVEKVATSKGRTSKVDILKLREDILDEIRRGQLNY
jgi:hypothetical protein